MKLTRKITALFSILAIGVVAALMLPERQAVYAESDWSADNKVNLDNDKAKISYTLGATIMSDIVRNGMADDIDVNILIAAQKDVINNVALRMSPEEMGQAQEAYRLKLHQEYAELQAKNKVASEAYLAERKTETGVKATDSGLLYKVLREGKGAKPESSNSVKIHYAGKLPTGKEFDSSYKRGEPAEFMVSGVVPGFSEGLQLMAEGAKYEFIIPPALAYGESGPVEIGPNQVLIFEVELLSIK